MVIEKIGKQHIEDAARIVMENYRLELKSVPSLPNNDFYDYFCQSINEIVENQYGIVAVQNNIIVWYYFWGSNLWKK
jgi:hypothetical protein